MIAVVDDDFGIRELICDVIGASGLKARGYASAEAFLSDGGEGVIDCIVLDVDLPGMNGFALAGLLQQQQPAPRVIFVTGRTTPAFDEQARAVGALASFRKPFNVRELVAAIRRATEAG